MTTIIDLSNIDFQNLLTFRKAVISLKESNSFAAITAHKNEMVTLRYEDKEVKGLVTQRVDVSISEGIKKVNLTIDLI